jgi:hypothetical protein
MMRNEQIAAISGRGLYAVKRRVQREGNFSDFTGRIAYEQARAIPTFRPFQGKQAFYPSYEALEFHFLSSRKKKSHRTVAFF